MTGAGRCWDEGVALTVQPRSAADARPRPGRRPRGEVRASLIEAGIELARAGGPGAVILREATRRTGVAPNAAYRHFADRDELLGAVCAGALRMLAQQMEIEVARVTASYGTASGATARFSAIGRAYLAFARSEPGLFETAFAVPRHLEYASTEAAAGPGGRTPLQLLTTTLDELAATGVLAIDRRPDAEYAIWASVHGMAMLTNQGPLRHLPSPRTDRLTDLLLAYLIRGL